MRPDIDDDVWCVSCNEEKHLPDMSLCKACAEAEFGDIPWVAGPAGEPMTESEAVAEALRLMGVNRASLRRQERAKRMHGKGFTKARKPKRRRK